MSSEELRFRALRLTANTRKLEFFSDPSLEGQKDVLRVIFRVTRNLKTEPNEGEIKIYNLAPDSRAVLEQPKKVPVLLEVGYHADVHSIFNGYMRNAITERDGSAIITTLTTGDGDQAIGGGRAFVNVPAKVTPAQLLELASKGIQSAGVGVGNLQAAQSQATATFGGPARTLHGSAERVFTDVCTMNGMNWSIQDGNLQVLKIGASVKQEAGAVKLSSNPNTGLVGSPSVDTKGILKAKALIQPGLAPGLPVIIDAQFVKGAYRIEEVEYTGDTWDTQWYAEITARKWV